jgi:phosphotransferase system  glucose/maltose/N-acetylglucosamine-specific IIC component
MRKIGKIFIFVASIIVLIAAVGISANVLLDCLKTPAVYFANAQAIFNFSWTIAAIVLLFLAGIYGITYAAKGSHRGFVAFIAWALLILGLISLTKAMIDCGKSNDWAHLWNYIDNWVYNGVGAALYCVGYFLSVKK